MQFEESDERIKNEGVITVRTVERIARESAAIASPKRPATARTKQATGIKNMLQALSKAVQACV